MITLTSMGNAFTQYKSQLPRHMTKAIVDSFSYSLITNLAFGAVFCTTPTSMIPLSLLGGSFAGVASLIDSMIRPLIGYFQVGHAGSNQRFVDWAGRSAVVMLLTGLIFSYAPPLARIHISARLIQRLMFSSPVCSFPFQFMPPSASSSPYFGAIIFSGLSWSDCMINGLTH